MQIRSNTASKSFTLESQQVHCWYEFQNDSQGAQSCRQNLQIHLVAGLFATLPLFNQNEHKMNTCSFKRPSESEGKAWSATAAGPNLLTRDETALIHVRGILHSQGPGTRGTSGTSQKYPRHGYKGLAAT